MGVLLRRNLYVLVFAVDTADLSKTSEGESALRGFLFLSPGLHKNQNLLYGPFLRLSIRVGYERLRDDDGGWALCSWGLTLC